MDRGNWNIILTGFMGTGKSTVGRLLAKRLGREWVDTDDLIESRHGPIPDIFARQGETAFRALERTVATELAERSGLVISTGGRTMLDPVAAAALEQHGQVFCLTASPAQILQRIGGDEHTTRPLLEGPDPQRDIGRLLDERRRGYQRFRQVATDGKTPAEVAEAVMALLDARVTEMGPCGPQPTS